MAKFDVWARSDRLEASVAEALAERLEARSRHPAYMQMMADYFDQLNFRDAREVLVLGAGTGVEARAIAKRPEFTATITAIF